MELDAIGRVREIGKFVAEVVATHAWNRARIGAMDDATQDILHEVELSEPKRGQEAARLYRQLRAVRAERRRCKEENELIGPLADWIASNQNALHALTRVQGTMSKTREHQASRRYTPRCQDLAALLQAADKEGGKAK